MANETARLFSLDEVRTQVARLQEEGQKLVGQIAKDAQALVERRPGVVRAIEEARKLRTSVRSRAEQAIAELDTRRTQAVEAVSEQLTRLAELAIQRLRLATHEEVADLSRRIVELEHQLVDLRKDKAQAA